MELTIESALSTGGMVGHLSYLLLVLSMVMRVMWVLRVLVIASACFAIAYDLIWLKDPVGVFWETLLVLVNVIQLTLTYLHNQHAKFDEVETVFVDASFPGLSNVLKRKILDAGTWQDGAPGLTLISEGQPVDRLIYIARGEAEITLSGSVIGRCQAGDLIGEVTALAGGEATGTATLVEPTRYWAISARNLRELVASNEEIGQAVRASFHRSMLAKLVAANDNLQKSGGLVSLAKV